MKPHWKHGLEGELLLAEIPTAKVWKGTGLSHGEPCIVCGRDLVGAVNHRIRVVDGGGTFVVRGEDHYVADGGDLGCQAVGPECFKAVEAVAIAALEAGDGT